MCGLKMSNKFKEIHTALTAKQNELVKTYGNDPRIATLEGKLGLAIMQLDTLTAVTNAILKELGYKVDQNRSN